MSCRSNSIIAALQGAGGVEGLLATSVNGHFYFPTYDNNGNVTMYVDESGNVVAAYAFRLDKTRPRKRSRAGGLVTPRKNTTTEVQLTILGLSVLAIIILLSLS